MAASSAGLHEPSDRLSPGTVDRHRAIVSLMEELEAVDWYDQRVEATSDESLAAVLAHNRDEEKEHAAMLLEWLRRHDPTLGARLREYLFTTAPITEVEAAAEAAGGGGDTAGGDTAGGDTGGGPADGSLGIGGLRGVA